MTQRPSYQTTYQLLVREGQLRAQVEIARDRRQSNLQWLETELRELRAKLSRLGITISGGDECRSERDE